MLPFYLCFEEEQAGKVFPTMGLSEFEYEFVQLMDEIFPLCSTFGEVYEVFLYQYPQYLFGSGVGVLKQNWFLYQRSLRPVQIPLYNPWV
jgi:hypothetical protein